MTFKSEYGEDAWIWRHLWDGGRIAPKDGFYVDVGAMRPDANSNTAFLREMGWHGLAIDAHPDCAKFWVNEFGKSTVPGAQFIRALVSDSPKTVDFISDRNCSRIVPAGHKSTAEKPVFGLTAYTLAELLVWHEVKAVDFLSIDIEGEEFNAMRTFPFDRFRPQVIVAEYATLQPDGTAKADFRLRELLLSKGYQEAHRTVANIIYVA